MSLDGKIGAHREDGHCCLGSSERGEACPKRYHDHSYCVRGEAGKDWSGLARVIWRKVMRHSNPEYYVTAFASALQAADAEGHARGYEEGAKSNERIEITHHVNDDALSVVDLCQRIKADEALLRECCDQLKSNHESSEDCGGADDCWTCGLVRNLESRLSPKGENKE